MLTAYFQSFKTALVVLSVLPGVLAGSLLLLWLTGNTVNIQSFMGAIMAIGVAVSNAILLVSKAEQLRQLPDHNMSVGAQAAFNRFRPIIMTSIAMIAGMLPMSLGLGDTGKQTAPLGIAVVGGLLFSVFTSLWLVPIVYDRLTGRKKPVPVSLDPNDENSIHYDKSK